MRKRGILSGIIWGTLMYVLVTFIFPIVGIDDSPITLRKSLISVPIWLIGGLLFGFMMNKIESRSAHKQNKDKP